MDVIVIGAGLAGLTAAAQLSKAGHDVSVLEANERVGGRTWSRSMSGVALDLGAQWVGSPQTRVLELARELNISAVPVLHGGRTVIDIGGRKIESRFDVSPRQPAVIADIANLGVRLTRLNAVVRDPEHSGSVATRSVQQFIRDSTWTQSGRDWWLWMAESALCRHPDEVSLADLVEQLAGMGGVSGLVRAEEATLRGGAQGLANGLAERLGDSVVLGTKVDRIQRRGATMIVHTDQRAWEAQAVVVAVPLALVSQIDFEPGLPAPYADYLSSVTPGRVVKSAFVYGRRIWHERGYRGWVMADHGPANLFADGSPDSGEGVLIALATGRAGERMSALSEAERKDALLTQAQSYFGDLGEPLAFETTDWSSIATAGGGYAARLAPGTCGTPSISPWKEHPEYLVFAGTEWASRWRSYMEGAIESGFAAATQLTAAHRSDA